MGLFDRFRGNSNTKESSFNFEYLDNMINSGEKVITLTHDIVFDDSKRTYEDGIKININNLVIDGNGHSIDAQGNARIFEINSKDVTIKNTVFKNGKNDVSGAVHINNESSCQFENCDFNSNNADYGGAISILHSGIANIVNCSFKDNKADKQGGAVYTFGVLYLQYCKLCDNSSESGGGVFNDEGTVCIIHSTFNRNSVMGTGSTGGAATNFGDMTIKDSTFEGNIGDLGAGIVNSTKLSIYDSTFTKNTGITLGGIVNHGGSLTIETCTMMYNISTTGKGGALLNISNGKVEIINSKITNNVSEGSDVIYSENEYVNLASDSDFIL